MSVRPLILPLALIAMIAPPAFAQQLTPAARSMVISGTGEVSAAPDMAMLSLGVTRIGNTADVALASNSEAMAQVLGELDAAGIADKDVQTSGFSIQPRYVTAEPRSDGTQEPPRIAGYMVSNTVTVRVRKLATLGRLLDRLVKSGSNTVNGISFTFAELQPLQDEARRLAVRDATARARLYAREAGVDLGPILSISEQPGVDRPPYPMAKFEARSMAAATPIAEGEQTVTANVTITWEIR